MKTELKKTELKKIETMIAVNIPVSLELVFQDVEIESGSGEIQQWILLNGLKIGHLEKKFDQWFSFNEYGEYMATNSDFDWAVDAIVRAAYSSGALGVKIQLPQIIIKNYLTPEEN